MDEGLLQACKIILRNVNLFCEEAGGIRLRSYQQQVAEAIVDSAIRGKGLSFVVVFPRQSGKNELQAQIETYLLILYSLTQSEIVKVSPTWKPQSLNAMRRLERVISRNLLTRDRWVKRSGYIYQVGTAMIHFLSGQPTTSIVGATANLLLECDEAQDVEIAKWDKEIAPMAASTNATRVFWGTAWTSRTLLSRELRAARLAQEADGIQRTWLLTADQVGAEVPSYKEFVDEQVSKLGRNNPLVRSQYFSEEIDAEGGMFPLARRILMLGSHKSYEYPRPGNAYALTIDVAGEDEGATDDVTQLANPRRDSTVLTVFEIQMPNQEDIQRKPVYKVVYRMSWQGVKHRKIYSSIVAMATIWEPVKVIIDATGVGAGLASFLVDKLGSKVVPFEFSSISKSDLGWSFISTIESGRYQEYRPLDHQMELQLDYCQYQIMDGPGKLMRWGVPDGTRDVATGELVHDDYILSTALISLLDDEIWGIGDSRIIKPRDILEELTF